MNQRNLLITLGLIAFVIVNWWLLKPSADAPADDPATEDQPIGWYVRGATIIGAGESGEPVYRLTARLIEQNPVDDSANLTQVRVRYDAGADLPWQLTAREGWIAADGQTIRLTGNVVLRDEPADGVVPTVVRTDALEMLIDSDLARTDQEVRIERGRNTLTALGMTAFLREDRVQLQSDVSGLFQP